MEFGDCKFCNLYGRFARAHIIPKSFYVRSDVGPPHIFSNKPDRPPKRAPVGVYDNELICVACEGKYEYLDGYAAERLKPWPRRSQLFREETGFILKLPGSHPGGYWLHGLDADRLKLFFVFLTLRCAKTNREEYRIKLPGDVLYRFEKALQNKDASGADIYVFGSRYFERKYLGTFSPWPRAPSSSKPLNFVMLGLRFLVHFQVPAELPELSLGNGPSWPIIFDEFKDSKLHQVAMQMVSKSPSPWTRLNTRKRAS